MLDEDMSVLLVTDKSRWGVLAADHAKSAGLELTHMAWQHGDADADGLDSWEGDWIVGFKADYILSSEELGRARAGAINFHPGPPTLRGVGTYQAAIEAGHKSYGVTCHHMVRKVDAGRIIATRHFDLRAGVGAGDLHEMAAAHLYLLYIEMISLIRKKAPLPESAEEWSGPLHTWKQLYQRNG